MQLIYVWTEEHFVLNNCGFNFSDKFQVTEMVDYENRKFLLDFVQNPNYVSNFFGKNIVSATAVVGENGVGKSSLLDLILRINHCPETIGGNWLAVFSDFKSNEIYITQSLHRPKSKFRDWKVETSPNVSVEFRQPISVEYNPTRTYQPNVVSIFYNPSLDLKDYKQSVNSIYAGIADVSTNYLIWEDFEKKTNDEYDQVEHHRFKNTYRQFALSESGRIEFKDLLIPDVIEVRFNKNRNVDESDLGDKAKDIYKWLEEYAREEAHKANYSGGISSKSKSARAKQKLDKVKVWFVWNTIYDFFTNLSYAKDLGDKLFKVERQDVEAGAFLECVTNFFDAQRFAINKDYSISRFISDILIIIDEYGTQSGDVDNDSFFNIPSKHAIKVHKAHLRYLALYAKRKRKREGFLDFNWPRDISNGEKAYLDLYSRLFDGYLKLQSKLLNCPTLFVLIDEGEVGFHPQWQKEYLNNILKFLRGLTDLKVQLIVTSHSPFVLSDLPRTNVILLERNQEGKSYVAGLTSSDQTFAANIHELFTDSFFIRNGTMGDFARTKIEEAIRLIKKEDITDIETENLRRLINLVGEPLIKDRLADMFNERFDKVETLESRISRLQTELEEARKEKNRLNDKN